MSKATKRKHVTKEVLDDFVLPEGEQQIVKIIASRGNNLHEAENASGERFLISMPTKYRKNVWIKRGDFVLTDPIEEGDKVKAEIAHILYKEQIKYIKQEGLWPTAFEKKEDGQAVQLIPDDMLPPSDSDDDDVGGAHVHVNPNHPPPQDGGYSSEEDSDSGVEENGDSS